jgi:ADP-ribosylglycohydrolase
MDIKTTSGSLFGSAFGDALAAPTEFLSIGQILKRWPPDGPQSLGPDHRTVTDDTQMALAVGEALVMAQQHGSRSIETVEPALRAAFVAWLRSPDNNRAPGLTCLAACERLERQVPWHIAGNPTSKGCGANMRVAPVGLLPDAWIGADVQSLSALAQFQTAMTHAHPTALAAADLTAFCVRYLAQKQDPDNLLAAARAYSLSLRSIYHHNWLGPLWERSGFESPESYIARGWDECLKTLDRLEAALRHQTFVKDPCLLTGAGWVAEEALATGLYCFLLYPDDPLAAIRRAALTSGDSDSIACLAGAFAGAAKGMDAWPGEWLQIIEYKERLSRLAEAMAD